MARLQKFSDALTAENKNVFSFASKVQTVQFNIRSSGGRLFHTRGPAIAKFLAPMAVRVRGTYRVLVSVDRSGRRPALLVALLRVARVTAGLAESNGSLPPGLPLTSPAG